MSSILRMRDYQLGANNALNKSFDSGLKRVAVVLPTGGGKTVIFAHKSAEYIAANPGKRVMILAHTDELVRQAAKKVKDVAPDLSVGIIKGAIRQTRASVIVASVQSLRTPRKRNQIKDVGFIIVDECHRSTAKTYRDILNHYGCFDDNGGAVAAGFTATLMRSDRSSLAEIWQDVAYRKDISFMIRAGHLLAPRGKRIQVDNLDLASVKKSGGDFQSGDLGEALEASLAPETVAKAYVEHASDRSGILFAPTVESAYVFAEELNVQGVKTEVVHGALETKERRAILARLESGETQVVANCMVLTEGFDCPRVSCVVVARPTKSSPLYQQMVGRGLRIDTTRPREGQDCLILDVVGVSANHTLASLVDLTEKKIELRDGQSIIEAEDELEEKESGDFFVPEFHDGPVVVVDFDPLASASTRVWLKTAGGTWFLSAGTQDGVYVFVVPATQVEGEDEPDPGTYDVMWATKSGYASGPGGTRGGITNHRGINLEMAFAWGEDVAVEMGGEDGNMTLRKSASWRSTKPSEKQLAMCKARGIIVPEGASKGDVSALIDTQFASKRIDPIARWFAQQAAQL